MSSNEAADQLRELLHDASSDPADCARRLAAQRTVVARGSPFAYELLLLEQRWLERFVDSSPPALQQQLAGARSEWLALRIRHLGAAEPAVAVVLDLAEAKAAAMVAGEGELALQCQQAIERMCLEVRGGPSCDHDVGERFALLTTSIDDLSIEHQIALLRETGLASRKLADANQSKGCRRIARRLLRASDDRELARRLERRLGRRGVSVLETTNFVLLLVVLVTLVVEATVDLSPTQALVFQWIDAIACLFFIGDFAFELALHPSRWSWFWRNALTDLVPAIPSVLFLLPSTSVSGAADNLLLLRALRLLRVTWAARYVQALRPLLRAARLLLFLVRGLDGLATRFTQILNREFVFLPAAADERRSAAEDNRRDLLFDALRREHQLVQLLPQSERHEALRERVTLAAREMAQMAPSAFAAPGSVTSSRDVSIAETIEFLWSLREQDLGRWLKVGDVQALDRVVRVLSAVPVRWLPLINRLAIYPLPPTPEERIVELGRRVADWLESWHGRMLFFADLHGIVTGPQILDRVATALVKASQRPAVRLLLFGGLFLLFDLLIRHQGISAFLNKIVGLPLVLLGSFCLIFLALGHWLKRLAGQASETYRLTSEAHFISQLERVQSRYEQEDLDFLAARVFRDRHCAHQARSLLEAQLASVRTGVPVVDGSVSHDLCLDTNRVALLYLHFLDGAPLHISDVKTTEQLLANQSLQNLRQEFLRFDARQNRQLRKLKLDDGSLFSGPYLWFRFITESVAVEAAKRISGYNSFCVPLAERKVASPEALRAMDSWLERRRDPRGGRTPKDQANGRVANYPTTEFTALDFLGGDRERDQHLAAIFGREVLDVVRFDRRTMVREIFGTRPVHHLPKHERSFNPLRFYERRLSHGRVLLAPLLLVWRFVRTLGWVVGKVRQIVREVLDPDVAMRRREIGEAPFAVALRKIHRMKAPGLLAAVRLRLRLDPVYAGAPAGWSDDEPFADRPEIERDLEFLHLREREAAKLREDAEVVRRDAAALRAALAWLPSLAGDVDGDRRSSDEEREAGELAVTCAWVANKDDVRTLLFAERWRAEELPPLLDAGRRLSLTRRAWATVSGWFVTHPVRRWLQHHGGVLPRSVESVLYAAYSRDDRGMRRVIDAWQRLPTGSSPAATAIATLRQAYSHGAAVRRDLLALRAVQSLAVLDVRNYRDLVFRIGDYVSDGEDQQQARALP